MRSANGRTAAKSNRKAAQPSGSSGDKPQVGARLSTQNRTPLYHQIYLILRSKILDGEYGPGEYLPGERDIEQLFDVSRITAVRALNAAGLKVTSIADVTPIPHNGCRAPKRRRV